MSRIISIMRNYCGDFDFAMGYLTFFINTIIILIMHTLYHSLHFIDIFESPSTPLHNIVSLTLPAPITAAWLFDEVPRVWRRTIFAIAVVAVPVIQDIRHVINRLKSDIRYSAEKWMHDNLPSGSYIAFEDYTPVLSHEQFKCNYIGICGFAYTTPDSIRKAGYYYIIASGHEHFYSDSNVFAGQISNYKAHKREFEVIKEFYKSVTKMV